MKRVDLIIFGGQSNMQGQTEGFPESNEPVEGAREYLYLKDCMIPLCNPVGETIGAPGNIPWNEGIMAAMLLGSSLGHGSLVPAFCRAYIKECGREVVAIHAAKGATKICEWLPGTPRYDAALKKITAGIAKIRESCEIGNIYYVWLQGESDAIDGEGTSESDYYRMLVEYKDALKRDAGIDKFGIIRVGYFTVDTPERDEAIMNAQERACGCDGDFVMLTRILSELCKRPEYINPYARAHFNNAAMEVIGNEAGTALAKI